MAPTYLIESDKIFLSCEDSRVINVHEIENISTFPVKAMHLTHIGTFPFGQGKDYESLKIGDKEITGPDLSKVMEFLIDSRLLVNREGLCYLPTSAIGADGFEVDYYRMFDLFDWSKYEVKTSIDTRWIRSDISEGRPLVPNFENELRQKEKELEEAKRAHQEELKEAKRKHNEELEEAKRKHKEVELEKDAELTKKDKEIQYLDDLVTLLDPSRQEQRTYHVYARVVPRFATPIPSSQITLVNTTNRTVCSPVTPVDIFPYTVNPIPKSMDPSSCKGVVINDAYDSRFDTDNWKLVWTSNEKAIAFYQGSKFGLVSVNNDKYQVGVPCPPENLPYLSNYGIKNVRGIGIRFILEFMV